MFTATWQVLNQFDEIINEDSRCFDEDNFREDVEHTKKQLEESLAMLEFREKIAAKGKLIFDGYTMEILPTQLKPKKMVFHAIIDRKNVGFDDYPTPLEELNDNGSENLPRDAVLVHHFTKMLGAKSEATSMVVELEGHWWWRIEELPDQFWSDLVAAFKKVHQNPKSNTFTDEAAAVAHLVKLTGGFQPTIVK